MFNCSPSVPLEKRGTALLPPSSAKVGWSCVGSIDTSDQISMWVACMQHILPVFLNDHAQASLFTDWQEASRCLSLCLFMQKPTTSEEHLSTSPTPVNMHAVRAGDRCCIMWNVLGCLTVAWSCLLQCRITPENLSFEEWLAKMYKRLSDMILCIYSPQFTVKS